MTWLNWPNRITLFRIALIIPFVICLLNLNHPWTGWRYLALAVLALMGLSDAVDGFLARRLNQITPLGRFLDPLADKLVLTMAVILLAVDATAVPGYQLPNWVPVIAVGKDVLMVLGSWLIHYATGSLYIQPRILGKACTAVQFVMITVCLIAPDLERFLSGVRIIFEASYIAASALACLAFVDYARAGNRWAAEKLKNTKETKEL